MRRRLDMRVINICVFDKRDDPYARHKRIATNAEVQHRIKLSVFCQGGVRALDPSSWENSGFRRHQLSVIAGDSCQKHRKLESIAEWIGFRPD